MTVDHANALYALRAMLVRNLKIAWPFRHMRAQGSAIYDREDCCTLVAGIRALDTLRADLKQARADAARLLWSVDAAGEDEGVLFGFRYAEGGEAEFEAIEARVKAYPEGGG